MGRCKNCKNTEDWKGINNYYCTSYRIVVDGDDGSDCRRFDPKYGSSSGGCVVTTACVEAMGLADDGPELLALRAFRDNYLLLRADGVADVEDYYRLAPGIVEAIDRCPDRLVVYQRIYCDMVVPVMNLWGEGKPEAAWAAYRSQIHALRDRYSTTP